MIAKGLTVVHLLRGEGPCYKYSMVTVLYQGKRYTFEGKVDGFKILRELGLKEEEVLLVKDGKLLPLDQPLQQGEVKVIPVVSGG